MQVNITYPASKRSKSLNIRTPSRKAGIKGTARRSYKTLASTIAKSPKMLASMLKEVCGAIKVEMKQLSSDKHDSVLRDNIEAVVGEYILLLPCCSNGSLKLCAHTHRHTHSQPHNTIPPTLVQFQ